MKLNFSVKGSVVKWKNLGGRNEIRTKMISSEDAEYIKKKFLISDITIQGANKDSGRVSNWNSMEFTLTMEMYCNRFHRSCTWWK